MESKKTSYQKEPDWDAINSRKRWEIIQAQTANMAWQEITADIKKPFAEKLEAYESIYKELLEVNKRLLLGGD